MSRGALQCGFLLFLAATAWTGISAAHVPNSASLRWPETGSIAITSSIGVCVGGRQGLTVADFDDDGVVEFVVAGSFALCGDACGVGVMLLWRANGTSLMPLEVKSTFPSGAISANMRVLPARFTADAVDDLLVHTGHLLHVYSFVNLSWAQQVWTGQINTVYGLMLLGDYDHNNRDDIFACGQNNPEALLIEPACTLYRNLNGSFVDVTASAFSSAVIPHIQPTLKTSHVVMDANGDGYVDWVVPTSFSYANGVYLNNRNGTFSVVLTFGLPQDTIFSLGRFNADNLLDLFFIDGISATFFLNMGNGSFINMGATGMPSGLSVLSTSWSHLSLPSTGSVSNLLLFGANGSAEHRYVLLNNGSGHFSEVLVPVPLDPQAISIVVSPTVISDSVSLLVMQPALSSGVPLDSSLLTLRYFASTGVILTQQELPEASQHLRSFTGSVVLFDINNDGCIDISALGNSDRGDINFLLLGSCNGTFTSGPSNLPDPELASYMQRWSKLSGTSVLSLCSDVLFIFECSFYTASTGGLLSFIDRPFSNSTSRSVRWVSYGGDYSYAVTFDRDFIASFWTLQPNHTYTENFNVFLANFSLSAEISERNRTVYASTAFSVDLYRVASNGSAFSPARRLLVSNPLYPEPLPYAVGDFLGDGGAHIFAASTLFVDLANGTFDEYVFPLFDFFALGARYAVLPDFLFDTPQQAVGVIIYDLVDSPFFWVQLNQNGTKKLIGAGPLNGSAIIVQSGINPTLSSTSVFAASSADLNPMTPGVETFVILDAHSECGSVVYASAAFPASPSTTTSTSATETTNGSASSGGVAGALLGGSIGGALGFLLLCCCCVMIAFCAVCCCVAVLLALVTLFAVLLSILIASGVGVAAAGAAGGFGAFAVIRRRHQPDEVDPDEVADIAGLRAEVERVDMYNVIDFDELRWIRKLGEGAYGEVFLADWNGVEVAVKIIKNATTAAVEDFKHEALMMAKVSHHPHVVRFIAASFKDDSIAMVLALCSGGSLLSALNQKKLDSDAKTRVLREVASAITFLHSLGIVHRDIAARNVLLDGKGMAKLADLGLSRVLEDKQGEQTTKNDVGPIRWMAPEAIKERKYSAASDCFSFAIMMVEVWSDGQVPYAHLGSLIDVAMAVYNDDARPSIPEAMPLTHERLLRKLWERDPSKRAMMAEAVSVFAPSTSAPTGETDSRSSLSHYDRCHEADSQ
jgi:predicted Ser/Thr protein kinase